VLPDSDDGPSRLAQPRVGITVSGYIGVDFITPPSSVVLRVGAVNGTAVPETAIEEDCDTRGGKDYVDSSSTVGD
jgi:hypothetical protein